MNPNYIHKCRIDLDESNCFLFFFSFFEAFKQKSIVKGATAIERHELKEGIAYCAKCRKYLVPKFHRFGTLSNDFFLEVRKLLIQYYPEKKSGISYVVHVTIDTSNE